MKNFYVKGCLIILAALTFSTRLFSQTVAEGFTLNELLGEGVTATLPHDDRNVIKWYSSKKAVVVDDMYFFTATTDAAGEELWVTDGTAAGTKMVKDINSGAESSSPDAFLGLNGKLYFTANNGENGMEVYVSDGTGAGTKRITDLYNVESADDIIVPAETKCLPLEIASIDTVWNEDGTEIVSVDTVAATIQFVEWLVTEQGEELTATCDDCDSLVVYSGRKVKLPTGHCYTRQEYVISQSGNGSSYPFALTAFGEDVLFTAQYNDGSLSSNGERWIFKYDVSEEQVVLVSSEIQAFPFYRINDHMRWNYSTPFQVIKVDGQNMAVFMGRDKKYGDEICITDGMQGGVTKVITDITNAPDENNEIEGATLSSSTLDWIQKVNDEYIIFRNSTPANWAGDTSYISLDQNPWATNGKDVWIIDDMNRNPAGANTRTSASFLGDYFLFKGVLYAGGQAGPIDKQITRFVDVYPQTQETWYINGPDDNGAYSNGRFGKAGYYKDPNGEDEYMFFSISVTATRTTDISGPAISKFNGNLSRVLVYTDGTYEGLTIADSLNQYTGTHGWANVEQITQYKDKLYFSFCDENGANNKYELYCFAFSQYTDFDEDTTFMVVDFPESGNPDNIKILGDKMLVHSNGMLYALIDENSNDPTPLYDPADHYMTVVPPAGWDNTYDYGFGLEIDVTKGEEPTNTSIQETVYGEIATLYPNPATNQITLELDHTIQPIEYSIIDINGKVMIKNAYRSNEINISTLEPGMYAIGVLTSNNIILTKTFVKR